MHGVGMNCIDFGRTGDVGGNDVDVFAAQPFVDFGRPHRCAAFGRQEQFGEDEQFCVGCGLGGHPRTMEIRFRRLARPGFSHKEGRTALMACVRLPVRTSA